MKTIPTTRLVVAAALVADDGRVLMQRRRLGAEHGGLWEFPGGKVEPEESPECALCRELSEELGIEVVPQDLQAAGFASTGLLPDSPERPLVILLYICRQWIGVPECLDGEEIGWKLVDALGELPMPPLDYPLAEQLCGVLEKVRK